MYQHFKYLAIFAISVLLILEYKSISSIFVNSTTRIWRPNNSIKTILYWSPMFRQKDYYLGTGQEIFAHCQYKNCNATYDRNSLPVDQYDALIFHAPDYTTARYGKPEKRTPNQVYIFANLESPDQTPVVIRDYNGFYNWTITYRSDSDIIRRYGLYRKQNTGYTVPSATEIRNRKKKIAWFVSRCHARSQREKLVDQIKKVVPVDVYGSCGKLKCPVKNKNECYDMMEKEYKFYLSFENSVCEDYVTEKMYNVLKRNVVPIVFGGANYDVLAPPKSVINVLDFESVKNLTDYIKYLDARPDEYLKYFEWKKNYVVDTSHKEVLCDLCKKLNEPRKTKVYGNIFTWWFGENINKCFDNVILKII
ncbi:alpha-(1,3)-fucosyltransferase C-like [Zophobas morio]